MPTIDDELALFGRAVERFAALGHPRRRVAGADHGAVQRQVRDLPRPARPRDRRGAVVPADRAAETPAFPLFIKPRRGRGGVGAYAVRNARELAFFLDYVADPVVQDYLDGPEFTIDVLCDFARPAAAIVPRERVVIRAGVIDRGRTVNDPRLIALAEACAEVLPFAGAVNIQCRMVDGRPVVFEINPRFSGGIPLTIAPAPTFRACWSTSRSAGGCRRDRPLPRRPLDDQLRVVGVPRGRAHRPGTLSAVGGRGGGVSEGAAIVLQARMGSTRLPGKALAPIAGRSILAHCLERLQARSGLPVVLATTTLPDDDVLCDEARALGVAVVRGPADDVLGRFASPPSTLGLRVVIRATADNPAVESTRRGGPRPAACEPAPTMSSRAACRSAPPSKRSRRRRWCGPPRSRPRPTTAST